jgi:Xaa-Pro dipeptidase
VLDINRQMTKALRPGVKCSEIHRLAVTAIEKAGAAVDRPEKLVGSRFGHGQGMLITEPPSINPRDHTVLEPGMVLSTEPGIRLDGVYFLWEDVHVITEDSHEQLTLETDELREIAF